MLPGLMRPLLALASPAGRRARLSILIFHRVLPAPDPLFPGEPDVSRFAEICGWLKSWCNVLPLSEGIDRLTSGRLPARAACITFDDGYADNYTHALPILLDHRLHATFFITTGFLDGGRMWNDTLIEAVRTIRRPELDLSRMGLGIVPTRSIDDKRKLLSSLLLALKHRQTHERDAAAAAVESLCGVALPTDLMLSTDQLRALRTAGMGIGAHTVSHPILLRCENVTAMREIEESRTHLESLLGERIGLFAYPNGRLATDYSSQHVKMVRELGFDAALTTNSGASRTGDDVFELRRFTPWDRSPLRFGLRLARNAREARR